MPKTAVSVTLDDDNLLWLRGRMAAGKRGNLSEALDALIADARREGQVEPGAIRSVVGTVDLGADPDLAHADADIRALFDASLSRPFLVREGRPAYGRTSKHGRGRRRG